MYFRPNILIVSVFQNHLHKDVNTHVHNETLKAMIDAGIPAIELQGRYKGVNELSILVEGFEYRQTVEKIAKSFNQESYLESHNDRHTNLIFLNGSVQSIGTLTPVSKEEAEKADAFSYNAHVNQYYIVK